MAFDLNNIVIDRIIRGVMQSHTDDSVLFSLNQIQNPSLTCSSESTDVLDAIGVPVATFYRAKTAEFSAENALFDIALMAAQAGTTKVVATTDKKVVTPRFETIDIDGTSTTYTLKNTPMDEIKNVYLLNGDGTLGTVYTKATSASATSFAMSGNILTPPTGLNAGDQLFVIYEYEATQAVSVLNSANNFPSGGKLTLEALVYDTCNQTKKLFAYLIFPNFKLSSDFDWNIQSDGVHPFSGKAMQELMQSSRSV